MVAASALLPGLHGLRATAALLVVLFHLHGIPPLPLPPGGGVIGSHFGLGVHLFFALSGFALAWSNPQAATRPLPYLIKRVFRIAPLYYAVLLVMLLVPLRNAWPGTARVLAEVSFTFNLVPAWSHGLVPAGWTVGVEMLFYLLLPALLRLRGVGAMLLAAAAATLLSYGARRLLTDALPGSDYASVSLPSNLAVFVAALLAFRIFERVRDTPASGRVAGLAAAFALGSLGALLSPWGGLLAGPGHPDLLLFGHAFAALCLWQALRPSALLRSRAALWFGERSYSVYLAHVLLILVLRPVYAVLTGTLGTGWAGFLACFAVTLPPLCLLAELGYRCVERPGIALGRTLIARLNARRATPARAAPAARAARP